MELHAYLGHVRHDGAALAEAARRAPDAAVPTCPGWDMTALVGHVGGVHRWVTGMLAARSAERGPFPEPPAGGAVVLAWYTEGLGALLAELEAVRADPDTPVWNWFDRRPAPARFWVRRMAHETAVHRWDAQLAAGRTEPIDEALAADGLDEYVTFAAAWLGRRPDDALVGTIGLAPATGAPAAGGWLLALHGDGAALEPADPAVAPAVLHAPSTSELLLWMTGRRRAGDPGFTVEGDGALVEHWARAVTFD